jgi:hypothetical protein
MAATCCHKTASAYYHNLGVTVDRVCIVEWVHLYTRLRTTSSYSAVADLHTLQITTAPAKPFPACCVFNSHSLATASNSGDPSASHAHVLSSQPPVQNSTELIDPTLMVITSWHRPHRKQHCVCVCCCWNVFTELFPRNCCGADHRKHRSSVVACTYVVGIT